jgi:hypothetical protein
MDGIFAFLPYSGTYPSVHGNISMADCDSMSFFALYSTLMRATLLQISLEVIQNPPADKQRYWQPFKKHVLLRKYFNYS